MLTCKSTIKERKKTNKQKDKHVTASQGKNLVTSLTNLWVRLLVLEPPLLLLSLSIHCNFVKPWPCNGHNRHSRVDGSF